MTYKNLLVHIDDTKANAGRAAAAAALARRHAAHLNGLYLALEYPLPAFIAGQVPQEVVAEQRRALGDTAAAAVAGFRGELERQGLSGDARSEVALDVDVAAVLGLHARYGDLLVVGQADPGEPGPGGPHMVEQLLLSCGRPLLIVPYIGAGAEVGRRVAIAWDGGREAARAVGDAMPALERAEAVELLIVNPKSGLAGHGPEPGADIATHLARHGIPVEVRRTNASDIDVGDAILSWIADSGADLLVMGGYGHTRLRELILGGATRRILESMTVPVLMSH